MSYWNSCPIMSLGLCSLLPNLPMAGKSAYMNPLLIVIWTVMKLYRKPMLVVITQLLEGPIDYVTVETLICVCSRFLSD